MSRSARAAPRSVRGFSGGSAHDWSGRKATSAMRSALCRNRRFAPGAPASGRAVESGAPGPARGRLRIVDGAATVRRQRRALGGAGAGPAATSATGPGKGGQAWASARLRRRARSSSSRVSRSNMTTEQGP